MQPGPECYAIKPALQQSYYQLCENHARCEAVLVNSFRVKVGIAATKEDVDLYKIVASSAKAITGKSVAEVREDYEKFPQMFPLPAGIITAAAAPNVSALRQNYAMERHNIALKMKEHAELSKNHGVDTLFSLEPNSVPEDNSLDRFLDPSAPQPAPQPAPQQPAPQQHKLPRLVPLREMKANISRKKIRVNEAETQLACSLMTAAPVDVAQYYVALSPNIRAYEKALMDLRQFQIDMMFQQPRGGQA